MVRIENNIAVTIEEFAVLFLWPRNNQKLLDSPDGDATFSWLDLRPLSEEAKTDKERGDEEGTQNAERIALHRENEHGGAI